MSQSLTNRHEIIFLYEARDCNPNGDPLDENRPRTDPETGQATVTDVRIKRTIRDYLHQAKGLEILIRDSLEQDGTLKDGKSRCDDFIAKCNLNPKAKLTEIIQQVRDRILTDCIDARLFGATLPIKVGNKQSSIKLTGPVQFSAFNRSLHAVNPVFIQQTAAFASKPGMTQKSFAERWILPYALICCHGVVNETAARFSGLGPDDLNLLLEGLWQGTNSLNTHSKMGHRSMLLINLTFRPGYHIGGLAERIKLSSELEETRIRKAGDYTVDITGLLQAMAASGQRLVAAEAAWDERLVLEAGSEKGSLPELGEKFGLRFNQLDF